MAKHCTKCRSFSPLPNSDFCLLCTHAELAARNRQRMLDKKRRKKAKRAKQVRTLASVSVKAETYETIRAAAARQGTSVQALTDARINALLDGLS